MTTLVSDDKRELRARAKVLEVSLCVAGGIRAEDTGHSEQILDAAHEAFPKGIGLQEVLLEAAQANGFTGGSFRSDMNGVLEAAFSTGSSVPGILSNVANKFLLDGFNSIEDAWKSIAAIRIVKNFKTVTSYRMSGGFEYEEVGPAGELKHGAIGEDTFTNQAKTYGKMFGLTRADLINDDLDAFTTLPFRIGRGGALKLNTVFWTTFLNNAAFFTVGNGNYDAGTDSVLDIAGLTAAELMFLTQTDSDSKPLAITPKTLLVPPALKTTAKVLMNSVELRNPGATKDVGVNNPHAGSFAVVHSAYLSNAAITGNSALAWYLLADKNDLSTIEVCFLDPSQAPTVETAQADFNTLGIQFRGYFDFGVALQEYRGGVKMKGEV